MERFAKRIIKALNPVLQEKGADPISVPDLELPPDPKMGDFAFPCFKLAKALKNAPPKIAQDLAKTIAEKISPEGELAGVSVVAAGPYLNFTVSQEAAVGALLKDILDQDGLGIYGKYPENSREKWVLEYSSPNVAKPFQIYHLRPTALGSALAKIGKFRGHHMVSINHLGDWGTQYGKLAVAFKRYNIDMDADLSMDELVDLYVRVHKDAADNKDETFEQEARDAFKKLEQGDPDITKLWQKCLDISLKEFKRLYQIINTEFDHYWGESFYKDQLQPLLSDLKKRGLLVEDQGAQVVYVTDEKGKELNPCILEKSDGSTIYATRDVAAAIYRQDQFGFDRMSYIVGGEQKLHFKQVFGVLRKMEFDWVDRCEHVPTGLYRFKDSKMSTRKGNFITFEDVLELAKKRVAELIQERQKDWTPEQIKEIAHDVGVGAILFNDLCTDPARNVEFDLEQVVSFEGETGPYLQYAHTRCQSILRNAKESGELKGDRPEFQEALVAQLKTDSEIQLVKLLGQFPNHLERTLKFAKASQLCNYLIDVVRAYGSFYRECHVLGQASELTSARLMLVEATRRILGQGMNLLGMPAPERM